MDSYFIWIKLTPFLFFNTFGIPNAHKFRTCEDIPEVASLALSEPVLSVVEVVEGDSSDGGRNCLPLHLGGVEVVASPPSEVVIRCETRNAFKSKARPNGK
ncbi:hypothetical protein HYU92_06605 [Candidatus Curtissbacteria bacterium]|nr:hypothetical protein [Candidatus Curtissbacteria bacterium]